MEELFKINLQRFAGEGEGSDTSAADTSDEGNPETVEDKEDNSGEKTFTQEELDEIIQDRLAREKAKQEEALERERQEAKRLAQLSAEEREKEIAAKQAKELEETKAELRRFKLEQDTVSRLSEEGLDLSFKDFLMGEDEAATNDNIKTFKKVFDKALQDAVDEKFKRASPTRGISANISRGTKPEDIEDLANKSRIIK